VGVEIVEDDVNGRVGVSGDDIIHEVEEFDAPPTAPAASARARGAASAGQALPKPSPEGGRALRRRAIAWMDRTAYVSRARRPEGGHGQSAPLRIQR
jgi:hypothetical protein